MARIRTIKPEFWLNEDLSLISSDAALLAIGLLNYSDDEGYFNANPMLIKAAVFPIRQTSCIATVLLPELSNIGYIELFSDSQNRLYGKISNFKNHQVINKPSVSKISCLELVPYNYGSGVVALPSGKERKGREDSGEENKEKNNKKENPLSLKTKSQLEAWEEAFGKFSIEHISPWIHENNLNPNLVKEEIESFRLSCQAKGYKYQSFPAAFKKWGCDKVKCKNKGGVSERDKWR